MLWYSEEIEESPYLVDATYPIYDNANESSDSIEYRYDLLANKGSLKDQSYDDRNENDYEIDSEELDNLSKDTSILYKQLEEENLMYNPESRLKESKIIYSRKKLYID